MRQRAMRAGRKPLFARKRAFSNVLSPPPLRTPGAKTQQFALCGSPQEAPATATRNEADPAPNGGRLIAIKSMAYVGHAEPLDRGDPVCYREGRRLMAGPWSIAPADKRPVAPGDASVTGLEDLRGLLQAVRAAGEKGLQVTRFKGLGEMNAEELRDTTLDPANRTLPKITMEDASAADDLFRILMGDKVEPRREFIEKHALEARNLDV